MLIALLGICSKEELEEEEDLEQEAISLASAAESREDALQAMPTRKYCLTKTFRADLYPRITAAEIAERREVIKNKILAVGKMSRVFAVLREESEAVSELKSVSGSSKLPAGTLANGAEGVKDSINSFGDARKSDIENERLPPDLIDAAEMEGMDDFAAPQSPSSPIGSPMSGVISESNSPSNLSSDISSSPSSPVIPETPRRTSGPGSPIATDGTIGQQSFKRGHSRQSSLGTTMTSPSTRRRSLDNTLSMIRRAMDAKDQFLENLADEVAAGASQDANLGSPARRGSLSR